MAKTRFGAERADNTIVTLLDPFEENRVFWSTFLECEEADERMEGRLDG